VSYSALRQLRLSNEKSPHSFSMIRLRTAIDSSPLALRTAQRGATSKSMQPKTLTPRGLKLCAGDRNPKVEKDTQLPFRQGRHGVECSSLRPSPSVERTAAGGLEIKFATLAPLKAVEKCCLRRTAETHAKHNGYGAIDLDANQPGLHRQRRPGRQRLKWGGGGPPERGN
jgi:hypothetical protein